MEILHIFSVTGNKNRKIGQEMGVEGRCGGARAFFDAAGRRGRRPPYRERLVVTFFYKPIDIVGFMCYHAITYKKDMLKE